jgi:hypothetical protein
MPFRDAPFREKSAALMLLLWLAATAFYLWEMQPWTWSLHFVHTPLKPLVVATFAIIIGSIVVQVALAIRSPGEAQAPADERERAILDRAAAWSGWILGFLAITSMLHYLQHQHGDLLFHTLFLSLLLAEIAEQAILIHLFRRGA